MAIGLKTAEQIKIQVGSVTEKLAAPPPQMMVKGKDMVSGIPVTRKIGHAEVARMLERSIMQIETAIVQPICRGIPEIPSCPVWQTHVPACHARALRWEAPEIV